MSYSNLRNTQMGSSGLARYCSAPSSYLASLFSPPKDLDTIFESDDLAQLFTPTPPCPPPPPRREEPPVMNSGWGNDIQSNNGTSGLIRQSSSPAGLFADINIENELLHLRGIGTGGSRFPWDDSNSNSNSLILSDDFLNGFLDDDNQGCESMEKPPVLSYRLSLPNQSFEKLLQDSVPCKIRARRGCATHPRSIAERVRRTKISERMKKLQELVPNMDKQTSTCDLLEFAVDYIKDLQSQVKALCEDRERCSCSAKYS